MPEGEMGRSRESGMTRQQLLLGAAAGGALAGLDWGSAGPAAAARQAVERLASPAAGGKEVAQLTWALAGDPVSLDYAFAYDFNTNPPVIVITEPLLRISPDGKLLPNLAESWKAVDSKTYVYHLRRGIKFHDGTEMRAEDAAASMSRIGDPKVGAYTSAFYERVKSVKATGAYEVTVKLTKPDEIWQYVPATTAGEITSAAFLRKHGKHVGQPGVGIIGTGPYKFVSWTKGQQVVLVRNDNYWDKRRPLKVKKIVFKVIQDEATIVAALGTGAVDGTFGNSISARSTVNLVKRFPDVKLYQSPSYLIHYLIINVQRKPFNDPRVREALSLAIDKAGLLESVWAGLGKVVKSPAVPALWTYKQGIFKSAYDKLPAFTPDIKKAKDLIQAAGAKGASASILVSTSFEEQLGLAIQAAGKQIGLNLTLTKVPATQKLSREFSGKTRDYDMSVSEWGSDIPDPSGNLVLPFMSKNVFTNDSQYRNPTVDKLFNQARDTLGPARRARLLAQGQAIVVGQQPWIVLYSPTSIMILNKRVTGYKMRPLWYWDPWAADLYGV